MNENKITLLDLHAAYQQWAGTPIASLELRHAEVSDNIPTAMDILFFQPPPEDKVSSKEFFTYITTAGMSTRIMQGPCQYVELILRVQGRHDLEKLKTTGRGLGELAIVPFREGTYFAPNLIVSNISLPLFEHMDSVLITNWGIQTPEYLPGLKMPVQLLSIHPIYASEADIIEAIGDVEASRRYAIQGINWDDPERPPAHLEEAPSVSKARKRKKKKTL